jgi:hypothetical protein
MAPPNPERQIHRACGDVRVALLGALELLSESTVSSAGCDDMFRAFSDLGRVERHVAMALHATNLLDQMVGTPVEHRPPWSYYRSRIGKKLVSGPRASQDECYTLRFDGSWGGDAARRSITGKAQTDSARAGQPVCVLDSAGGDYGFAGR